MCSILPDFPPHDLPPEAVAAAQISEGPAGTLLEAAQLQDRAQQLRLVANRIEEFLVRQIERLQQAITETGTSLGQVELGAMREDFDRLRDRWEVERQQEIQQLRDDAQRLFDAWKYLENEQRELMLRQAAIRSTPGHITADTDAYSESGPLHPMRLSTTGTVAAVGTEIGGIAGAATIQKAQLQFQQLRREMQRHAQQRKKY